MSAVLQTKVLRPKTSEDELAVYTAALEWDLVEPIVIESQEDIKSKVRWLDRLTPFAHQVMNLITFCRRLPVTLLADDVGLGKTISAGLILSELISRDRVANTLVVCPKLLGPQWKSELEQKFGIPAVVVTGRDLLDEPPGGEHVVITTYQSARLYLEQLPPDRFQMLILDEAHKLRNLYGVEKPPMVATLFRKLLEARRFRFVLMLTATPIHNRLWDIYSLVDLLTVARGHKNPFGAPGAFARKYIADSRETARQLRPEAQSEFRSIVYGYMSRTRRSDANLHFPERVIRNHTPLPSPGELALIDVVGKHIIGLNRLAQISILQALASSPDALKAQIQTMGRNGTVSAEFVADVKHVIGFIGTSAKLQSLGKLFDGLMREDPRLWRVVVFTCRRETQTTIQAFCEGRGLNVGIINGDSGANNQLTIDSFKTDPPKLHVIVSTEAGSEGVNLQVANVLVNFDLPWNPMIVEQRIGRVQRLASRHANVLIYNVTLRGTFEEYIVGRLLEKLQMASHAIGDIESLLEAAGASDEDDDGASFEECVRLLVVAALTGKDFEAEARLTEASISRAQETLATEKQNIDAMLSSGAGAEYVGPRAPKLSSSDPGMDLRTFTLRALSVLGTPPEAIGPDLYRLDAPTQELITFDAGLTDPRPRTLYSASSSAFQRLVDRVVATGIHDVHDHDVNPSQEAAQLAARWVSEFGGAPKSLKAAKVWRSFQGTAMLRVRVTVAHDSYERLISVKCDPETHHASLGMAAMESVARLIDDPVLIGVNVGSLRQAGEQDPSVSEFCRFYVERREQELLAVGDDARRRKKIEEDFTPRLTFSIVSLAGIVRRRIGVRVSYQVVDGATYTDDLVVAPSEARVLESPIIEPVP